MQLGPSAFNGVIEKHKNKGMFMIDLNDETYHAFYKYQLKLAGINSSSYPAFFRAIEESKTCLDKIDINQFGKSKTNYPVNCISSINSPDGKRLYATAITSLPVKAVNITQTLGFFDEGNNPLGPVSFEKTYNEGNESIIRAHAAYKARQDKTTKAEEIRVIYTFSLSIEGETALAGEVISSERYPASFHNINPKNILGNEQIKVCLTRDSADCDYKTSWVGAGTASVPIQGSILYHNDIDLQDGKPVNTQSKIYLIRVQSGGTPINPVSGFDFFNDPNTKINGKELSWNLNWLTFDKIDFNSGDQVYYIFNVTVQAGGVPVTAFITNAPNTIIPEQTIRNTATIHPMYILYGCLGGDTLITLENGSKRALRKIQSNDIVLSNNQEKLRVDDIITGREDEVVKIVYANHSGEKKYIISSMDHPFLTKRGTLLAKELLIKDQLLGPDENVFHILGLKLLAKPTTVYNLQLSPLNEAPSVYENGAFMVANGIYVGDMKNQVVVNNQKKKEQAYLNTINSEWKTDYENYQGKLNLTNTL